MSFMEPKYLLNLYKGRTSSGQLQESGRASQGGAPGPTPTPPAQSSLLTHTFRLHPLESQAVPECTLPLCFSQPLGSMLLAFSVFLSELLTSVSLFLEICSSIHCFVKPFPVYATGTRVSTFGLPCVVMYLPLLL